MTHLITVISGLALAAIAVSLAVGVAICSRATAFTGRLHRFTRAQALPGMRSGPKEHTKGLACANVVRTQED